MPTIRPIARKVILSSPANRGFEKSGDLFQKDFIRAGVWTLPDGSKLPVDDARIQKWAGTFKLFRDRGITVPLTVDHIEVRDENGKMIEKKLTPGMTEAKRGDVVNLFADGGTGMFAAKPADAEAEQLMLRCPEVSLELDYDLIDGDGNYYDEAITAITLTPKPVIPRQQGWQKVAASRVVEGDGGVTIYLSAEMDAAVVPQTAALNMEQRMTPAQIARARQICSLAPTVTDEQVADHLLNHVASQSTELTSSRDTITRLSRDVQSAGAAPVMDEDAAEMAAGAIETRVNSLRATPAQKTALLSLLCGTAGKRPAICLSRKVATKMGLDGPLADSVLKVFEAGDPAELMKLLEVQTGSQRKKVLSREGGAADDDKAEFDPELQKSMIANANGAGPNTTVL